MTSWSNDNFTHNDADTTLVFYPFSGPDFLHAYFLYPNAIPIFDVIAAVLLSFIRIPIEKKFKKTII